MIVAYEVSNMALSLWMPFSQFKLSQKSQNSNRFNFHIFQDIDAILFPLNDLNDVNFKSVIAILDIRILS